MRIGHPDKKIPIHPEHFQTTSSYYIVAVITIHPTVLPLFQTTKRMTPRRSKPYSFSTLLKAENIQIHGADEATQMAKAYVSIYLGLTLFEEPTVTKKENEYGIDYSYEFGSKIHKSGLFIRTDEAGSVLEAGTRLIASKGIAAPTPAPPFVESVPIESTSKLSVEASEARNSPPSSIQCR